METEAEPLAFSVLPLLNYSILSAIVTTGMHSQQCLALVPGHGLLPYDGRC